MLSSRPLVAIALIGAVGAIGCGDQAKSSGTPSSCRAVESAKPHKDRTHLQAPTAQLPSGSKWNAVIETNCGSFTIQIDSSISPKAAAAFTDRIRTGFYDGLSFHRIAPGFVIQGGDPEGTGLGGPGYTTVDKPPVDQQYVRAAVAMAKSPDQPPGAAGSQFFVMTGEDSQLTPDYAVVGEVTEGMATVDRISSEAVDPKASIPGQSADGPPVNPIVIKRATVTPAS